MDKPDVDYIKGLAPAIAIEQKVITRTPRSTVGSMTEIYDYLRLLYARIGKTISPVSGREVKKDDVRDVLEKIKSLPAGAKVFILSVFKLHRNRRVREELNILMQKGFSRIYIREESQSETAGIEDLLEMDDDKLEARFQPNQTGTPAHFILIDRIVVKELDEDDEHRLGDSIGTAFYEGEEMFIL
jgi:excinuclease ABC subunit A